MDGPTPPSPEDLQARRAASVRRYFLAALLFMFTPVAALVFKKPLARLLEKLDPPETIDGQFMAPDPPPPGAAPTPAPAPPAAPSSLSQIIAPAPAAAPAAPPPGMTAPPVPAPPAAPASAPLAETESEPDPAETAAPRKPAFKRIQGLSERNLVTNSQGFLVPDKTAPEGPRGEAPARTPQTAPPGPAAAPKAERPRRAPRARAVGGGGGGPAVYTRHAPESKVGGPSRVGEQVYNQYGVPIPPEGEPAVDGQRRPKPGAPDTAPPPNPEKVLPGGRCARKGWWKNPTTNLCYHNESSCLTADFGRTACLQP